MTDRQHAPFNKCNFFIECKDSTVNATVHETDYASGAAIGSGDQGKGITIDVSGSTIVAHSKTQNTGACIGSGRNGENVDITIVNSSVTGSQNGRTWQDVGCVIGSGREAGNVRIVLKDTVVVGSIVGGGVYSNNVYVSAEKCKFDVR